MNILNKIANFFKSLFSAADVNDDGKVSIEDIKAVEKKTKKEIQAFAKKVGVVLDAKLTKAKMVAELKKQTK